MNRLASWANRLPSTNAARGFFRREDNVSHPNAVLAPTHTNDTSGSSRTRSVKNSPRAVPAPTVTKHQPRPGAGEPGPTRSDRPWGLRSWWNDRFGHLQASRKNSPRAVPAPTVTKHAPKTVEAPPAGSSVLDSVRSWFADRFDSGRVGRLD